MYFIKIKHPLLAIFHRNDNNTICIGSGLLVIAIDKEIMPEGKLVPKAQPRDTKAKDSICISNYMP